MVMPLFISRCLMQFAALVSDVVNIDNVGSESKIVTVIGRERQSAVKNAGSQSVVIPEVAATN